MKTVRSDSSRNARTQSATKKILQNGTRKWMPAAQRKKRSTLNESRKLKLPKSELRWRIFFSTSFRQNETYAKLHASRSQTRSQNQTACPGGNTLPGNLRKISSMILTVNFQNWNPGDPWRHQWDPKSLRAKLHRALLHKERLERHRKHLQGKNRRTVKKFWDFFYKFFLIYW